MVVSFVSTFILQLYLAGGMLYAFKANVLAASQDALNYLPFALNALLPVDG